MRDRAARWLRALADRVEGLDEPVYSTHFSMPPEWALNALNEAEQRWQDHQEAPGAGAR